MSEQFKNEPYTVVAENYIKVCANCFPGKSIFTLFPDLAHCEITHGICPGHAAIYRREIVQIKTCK